MFVPSVNAGTAEISIELDLPSPDNIMGWEYELQFISGSTGAATDVQDADRDTTFYTSRLSATQFGSGLQLRFTRALNSLRCDPDDDGAYVTCPGGKFKLKSIRALSWFRADTNAGITTDDEAGRLVARKSAEITPGVTFSGLTTKYGSPLATTAAAWDAIFYVGA